MKIAHIYNECTSQVIPFENFLRVDCDNADKLAVSWSQTTRQLSSECEHFHEGGKPRVIGLSQERNPLLRVRMLATVLDEFGPDIVHTHHALTAMLTARVAYVRKYRSVVTVHNDIRYMRWRHRVMFAYAYRRAERIICNSETTRHSIEGIARRWFPDVPVLVNYNGVNIDAIGVRNGQKGSGSLRDRPPRLVMTARFVKQKDHETLLHGFARLRARGVRATLALIGDGPLRPKIVALAEELEIAHVVSFMGSLPRSDVYRVLRESDVFLMTSRWEGFCNALVEAAAAGLPIIASNIATLREVLGAENGFFFEPGDPEDLAATAQRVVVEFDHALQRANCAREWVVKSYSLDASAAIHAEIYKNMVRESGSKLPGV